MAQGQNHATVKAVVGSKEILNFYGWLAGLWLAGNEAKMPR